MTNVEAANFDPLAGLQATNSPTPDRGKLGQAQFLELMITQLRNQDPFKPMESGEFLGQLAQFGTVSGIADLQNSFKQLSSSLVSNQALQASSLIGKDVLVATDGAELATNGSLSGAIDLPEDASAVKLNVYDEGGTLVRTIDLGPQPAGLASFTWDGRGQDGQPLPAGTYSLRAEATFGAQPQAVETLISTRVESVTMSPYASTLILDTADLDEVSFADVRQIS